MKEGFPRPGVMGQTRFHDLEEIAIKGEGPGVGVIIVAAVIGTVFLTLAKLKGAK